MNFFATCGKGLEPILATELAQLGAGDIAPGRGGVSFSGDLEMLYRANLWLRTAVRVLRPVLEADVFSPEDLYEACRSVLWSNYMSPQHTLAVDSNVRDSRITHSQYAARKVKDAICDQFRDRTGTRPSVDVDKPMVGLNLHIARNHMILSLDSSWDSLHKRGYRPIQTKAPLNEALTAGILQHLKYDGSEALVDPMCGSGTFLIEASLIATERPPGLTRDWYGFFGWLDFDRAMWSAMTYDARRSAKPRPPNVIDGRDHHAGAVRLAQDGIRAASMAHAITVSHKPWADQLPPGGPPGLLVVNPPYGERLGEEADLLPLYQSLGERSKSLWPGWRLAVLTSSDQFANAVGRPIKAATAFFNGSIACKLYEFE